MLNQRSDTIFHILGELDTERKKKNFKCKTFMQSIDNVLSRALQILYHNFDPSLFASRQRSLAHRLETTAIGIQI